MDEKTKAAQLNAPHQSATVAVEGSVLGPQTKTRTGPVARIDLLEGVRGVLACWVMIGHFVLYLGGATLLQTSPSSLLGKSAFIAVNGDVPVCLFMIISGFVICHLVQSRGEPYGVYISRRFMRLFPALACCFVLGLLVSHWQSTFLTTLPWGQDSWLADQASKSFLHRQHALPNILAHLTMVHGLIPPSWWPDASGAFLGPAWSISTEWQFYLIAPLAIAAARRLSTFLLLCLCVVFSQVVFSRFRLGTSMESFNGAFLGFYMQYFFIGGLSYLGWRVLRQALSGVLPSARPLQGMVLGGFVLSFFLLLPVGLGLAKGGTNLTPFLPISILGIWIFIFACLCQVTAAPNGLEARIIEKFSCSPPALFLGRCSYSIYLVHFPLAIVLLRLSGPMLSWPRPLFVVTFLVAGTLATVLAAGLLYRFVEAPAIQWAKEKFGER